MKKVLPIIVTAVIVGVAAFYGGMVYGKGSGMSSPQGGFQNFRGASGTGAFGGRGGGRGGFGGATIGQIIGKDDKSITLQTMDGSSKIVFYSGSTQVMKSVAGTPNDLVSGEQVVVMGSANSDGSVTAQNVQIRPASSTIR